MLLKYVINKKKVLFKKNKKLKMKANLDLLKLTIIISLSMNIQSLIMSQFILQKTSFTQVIIFREN